MRWSDKLRANIEHLEYIRWNQTNLSNPGFMLRKHLNEHQSFNNNPGCIHKQIHSNINKDIDRVMKW